MLLFEIQEHQATKRVRGLEGKGVDRNGQRHVTEADF
jgi:hypothetical protein